MNINALSPAFFSEAILRKTIRAVCDFITSLTERCLLRWNVLIWFVKRAFWLILVIPSDYAALYVRLKRIRQQNEENNLIANVP